MKSFLASCALVSVSQAIQVEGKNDFAGWMAFYNKSYTTTTETTKRQANWNNADKIIKSINANKSNTFKVEHNVYSDRDATEFATLVGPTKSANKYKP